ncbi:hypothetical protein JX266_008439 [Neoarthrinium moseri]|nr:hypothetical protein JX266_008439 [Neoarthrinium moseri]
MDDLHRRVCDKAPLIECEGCGLVKYCSDACRKADLKVSHQGLCNSYRKEASMPSKVEKDIDDNGAELWEQSDDHRLIASLPAYNMLDPNNDLLWDQEEIHVLLGASGDLGTLIKTIVEIPQARADKFVFVLNDRNARVVCRNLIMLIACISPDNMVSTAEVIIHLWYSARLPSWAMQLLRDRVALALQCFSKHTRVNETPNMLSMVSLPWGKDDKSKLELALRGRIYEQALEYLDCKPISRFDMEREQSVSGTSMAANFEANRELSRTDGRWRFSKMLYRLSDAVLPVLTDTREFNQRNHSFFQKGRCLHESRQPINGWRLADVLQVKSHAASNDLYGKLFHYLRPLLVRFMLKLQSMEPTTITMTQIDLNKDTTHLLNPMRFDLIDVTNMELTSNRDVFEATVAPLKTLLCEKPSAGIIGRFHSTDTPASDLHAQAARCSLQVRREAVLDSWGTESKPKHLCILEWNCRADGREEEGQHCRNPVVVERPTRPLDPSKHQSPLPTQDRCPTSCSDKATTGLHRSLGHRATPESQEVTPQPPSSSPEPHPYSITPHPHPGPEGGAHLEHHQASLQPVTKSQCRKASKTLRNRQAWESTAPPPSFGSDIDTEHRQARAAGQAKLSADTCPVDQDQQGLVGAIGEQVNSGSRAAITPSQHQQSAITNPAESSVAQQSEAGSPDISFVVNGALKEAAAKTKTIAPASGIANSAGSQEVGMDMAQPNGNADFRAAVPDVHPKAWSNQQQKNQIDGRHLNSRRNVLEAHPYTVRPAHKGSLGQYGELRNSPQVELDLLTPENVDRGLTARERLGLAHKTADVQVLGESKAHPHSSGKKVENSTKRPLETADGILDTSDSAVPKTQPEERQGKHTIAAKRIKKKIKKKNLIAEAAARAQEQQLSASQPTRVRDQPEVLPEKKQGIGKGKGKAKGKDSKSTINNAKPLETPSSGADGKVGQESSSKPADKPVNESHLAQGGQEENKHKADDSLDSLVYDMINKLQKASTKDPAMMSGALASQPEQNNETDSISGDQSNRVSNRKAASSEQSGPQENVTTTTSTSAQSESFAATAYAEALQGMEPVTLDGDDWTTVKRGKLPRVKSDSIDSSQETLRSCVMGKINAGKELLGLKKKAEPAQPVQGRRGEQPSGQQVAKKVSMATEQKKTTPSTVAPVAPWSNTPQAVSSFVMKEHIPVDARAGPSHLGIVESPSQTPAVGTQRQTKEKKSSRANTAKRATNPRGGKAQQKELLGADSQLSSRPRNQGASKDRQDGKIPKSLPRHDNKGINEGDSVSRNNRSNLKAIKKPEELDFRRDSAVAFDPKASSSRNHTGNAQQKIADGEPTGIVGQSQAVRSKAQIKTDGPSTSTVENVVPSNQTENMSTAPEANAQAYEGKEKQEKLTVGDARPPDFLSQLEKQRCTSVPEEQTAGTEFEKPGTSTDLGRVHNPTNSIIDSSLLTTETAKQVSESHVPMSFTPNTSSRRKVPAENGSNQRTGFMTGRVNNNGTRGKRAPAKNETTGNADRGQVYTRDSRNNPAPYTQHAATLGPPKRTTRQGPNRQFGHVDTRNQAVPQGITAPPRRDMPNYYVESPFQNFNVPGGPHPVIGGDYGSAFNSIVGNPYAPQNATSHGSYPQGSQFDHGGAFNSQYDTLYTAPHSRVPRYSSGQAGFDGPALYSSPRDIYGGMNGTVPGPANASAESVHHWQAHPQFPGPLPGPLPGHPRMGAGTQEYGLEQSAQQPNTIHVEKVEKIHQSGSTEAGVAHKIVEQASSEIENRIAPLPHAKSVPNAQSALPSESRVLQGTIPEPEPAPAAVEQQNDPDATVTAQQDQAFLAGDAAYKHVGNSRSSSAPNVPSGMDTGSDIDDTPRRRSAGDSCNGLWEPQQKPRGTQTVSPVHASQGIQTDETRDTVNKPSQAENLTMSSDSTVRTNGITSGANGHRQNGQQTNGGPPSDVCLEAISRTRNELTNLLRLVTDNGNDTAITINITLNSRSTTDQNREQSGLTQASDGNGNGAGTRRSQPHGASHSATGRPDSQSTATAARDPSETGEPNEVRYTELGARIRPGYTIDQLSDLERFTCITWEEITHRVPPRDVPWTEADKREHDETPSTRGPTFLAPEQRGSYFH